MNEHSRAERAKRIVEGLAAESLGASEPDDWWQSQPDHSDEIAGELEDIHPGDCIRVVLWGEDNKPFPPSREYEYWGEDLNSVVDDKVGYRFRHEDAAGGWNGALPWRRADEINLPPECRTALIQDLEPYTGKLVKYGEMDQCRHHYRPELDTWWFHYAAEFKRQGKTWTTTEEKLNRRENHRVGPCAECPYKSF